MKSLRANLETLARDPDFAVSGVRRLDEPQPLAPARWDWSKVERVLIVRLRSIGDTVLATPALRALRKFLPDARIDILLESWVAPVLDGFADVDNIITVERGSPMSRARVLRELRATRYDVAFNFHGGTTATLLVRATGARHRVGYANYQYKGFYNHAAPPSAQLWQREKTHSVEQQLALLGWTGVPVTDRPPTHLAVTKQAAASVAAKLHAVDVDEATPFALVHPAAAFDSKQWAGENFARVAEELAARGIRSIAVAAPDETETVKRVVENSRAPINAFTNLSLQEITALAARARIFVGNDSGIAHIASAVSTPSVVIFGSSNIAHWSPWAVAPAEIVREEMACAPCPGYTCPEFELPQCIRRVPIERVTAAIERVLKQSSQSSVISSQSEPDGL